MTATADQPVARPAGLSRERILAAAVELVDNDGLDALTMRNLAKSLGVEAMSLYYHIDNKDALLDGLVDAVVGEIVEEVAKLDLPAPADDWKTVMRSRILVAREVMFRHSWAPEVIESRTSVSPFVLKYFNDTLGLFRQGGFSYDLAHHAMHALGSRALGFTQELFEPDDAEQGDEENTEMIAAMAEEFPYLVEMLAEISHDDPDSTLGWCDDQTEFEFGLDLLLDGLERHRAGN